MSDKALDNVRLLEIRQSTEVELLMLTERTHEQLVGLWARAIGPCPILVYL